MTRTIEQATTLQSAYVNVAMEADRLAQIVRLDMSQPIELIVTLIRQRQAADRAAYEISRAFKLP